MENSPVGTALYFGDGQNPQVTDNDQVNKLKITRVNFVETIFLLNTFLGPQWNFFVIADW